MDGRLVQIQLLDALLQIQIPLQQRQRQHHRPLPHRSGGMGGRTAVGPAIEQVAHIVGVAQLAHDRRHRCNRFLQPVVLQRQGDQIGGIGRIHIRAGDQLEDHVANQMATIRLRCRGAISGGQVVGLLQVAVGEGTAALQVAVEGRQQLAEPALERGGPQVVELGGPVGATQHSQSGPQQPRHQVIVDALTVEVAAEAQPLPP